MEPDKFICTVTDEETAKHICRLQNKAAYYNIRESGHVIDLFTQYECLIGFAAKFPTDYGQCISIITGVRDYHDLPRIDTKWAKWLETDQINTIYPKLIGQDVYMLDCHHRCEHCRIHHCDFRKEEEDTYESGGYILHRVR